MNKDFLLLPAFLNYGFRPDAEFKIVNGEKFILFNITDEKGNQIIYHTKQFFRLN